MPKQLPVSTLQPMVKMLSDEQVRAIHYATLEILSQTGVEMQDPQGRELLLEAGAWESNARIKIPENMVTDAIANAPSRIPMHDRLGNLTMPLELGKVFFGSGSDTTFTLDVETGERRRTIAQDVENIARLCDALYNIDFVMSMGNPSDVPPDDLYIHEFISMIRGSVKPNVYTAKNRADMEDIYRIAAAVAGGEQALREKPFFLLYAEPISPLLFPEESLQKLIFCAEKGIPAAYPPSTNTGGGGPITLVGALALGNAECLVGLIVSQLIRPGTPFLYGMNTAALDMKSAIVSYGSPEWPLGMMAQMDLARYYNLPAWSAGGASDSKVVDAQAGIEMTFSILTNFLARATLVHDVGYIEYGSTSSMEALVIADEIIREARYLTGGLDINPTTLALDAIARVRPGGGFLADDHTLDNFRTSQWIPRMIDRSRYDSWKAAGSKDMYMRANERAREILAEHKVPPLSADAEAVITEILAERAD
ncbi:MAG: trimethylamine methyltransferase family protein [Chloroflexi bacterium]|nr:trimethylamine methyltransferase family protein [Chloroflexota bacterium]MBU1661606.1 trimethylamine methyltransferase family protein [Chloroflexota bacterium]